MRRLVERLQPIGRALMLPIAVLPVAGLLLRLGQPDMLGIAYIAAAGDAIFANLGLLFAIGVAVGLARDNHGAAGLAGVVCYLVTTEGAKALLPVPSGMEAGAVLNAWRSAEIAKLSTPAGILAGLTAGSLYNRYSAIAGPSFLSFFTGRRFVPIAAGAAGLVGALVLGYGFPILEGSFDAASRGVVASGPLGLFLYGALNRLLLVTGLHHILNNIAWFIIGDFHGATGDLKRFFAGDPSAGTFMSGFFPVMMFGLPAACLAIYRAARPDRRAGVGGMLLSLALTSFLTGVTEPIEFTFMFLAPALFALHAVLTGLAMVVMDALGVRLGFGFSAGFIDYALNFGIATSPLLLVPIGLAYALVYYAAFSYVIRRFNLPTPGRESDDETSAFSIRADGRGAAFAEALGGAANLAGVDACTTRLRLTVVDQSAVNERRLKELGARGVLKHGGNALQVVLGPIADTVASEIRDAVRNAAGMIGQTHPACEQSFAEFLPALGGEANVASIIVRGNRVICDLQDSGKIDLDSLPRSVIAVAQPSGATLHLLLKV